MHAYQSLVWNRAATARAQLGLDLLEGDLVLPQGAETETGKPKGEDAEQARLVTAADLAAGELSFDDVVLPLPGFAMTYPKVEAVGAVYEAAPRADVRATASTRGKQSSTLDVGAVLGPWAVELHLCAARAVVGVQVGLKA